MLHFPIFIWAIRDFILKREIDGEVFEDDDSYLEWALTQKRGQKRSIKQANDVKGAIRRFFPERRCFLFPIPVANSELMTNLDQATEEDLAQSFRDVSGRFLDYVFSLREPKRVEGKGLNGRMYMTLVDNYVGTLRNDDVPLIARAMWVYARQEKV